MGRLPDAGVRNVTIGRKYTAVTLGSGGVGVAVTHVPRAGDCGAGPQASAGERNPPVASVLVHAKQRLRGVESSKQLIGLLTAPDPIEASAALACVNALVNRLDVPFLPGDLLERLEVRPSDVVGMVGYFGPLVGPLKRKAKVLHIFEQREGEGLLAADDAFMMLPGCDIAVITSGAISNATIDPLLEAASPCREVAMVGASTPLLPAAFRASPVTWLSGSVVAEPELTVKIVAEGGGRREFNPYLTKVNLRIQVATKEE